MGDGVRSTGSDHSWIVFWCQVSQVPQDLVVVITAGKLESELDGDLVFSCVSEVGQITMDC